MKILLISHAFVPESFAGTEIYTYNLAKELIEIGHEVFVLHRSFIPGCPNYYLQLRTYNNIPIIKINKNNHYKEAFEKTYNNNSIDTIFKGIIDYINPDLVHINHLMFLSFNIVNILYEKKIPVVMTLHDYWLVCPQIHCHKNYDLCYSKNKTDCNVCIANQGYDYDMQKIIERDALAFNILKKIDLLISPSLFLRDKFSKYANLEPDRVVHIPNGLTINSLKKRNFNRQSLNHNNKPIVLSYFGNINQAKGLHVLLDAFYKLDNTKYDLKIYGKLDGNYAKILDSSYSGWRKYYFGSYANDQIYDLLRNDIDILVFPSIIFENYPTVILESLSAGVPVISTNIGGAKEIINKIDGLLFENMNSNDLKNKIELLTFDKIFKMKKNLLSYKIDSFENHVKILNSIYDSITKNKKSGDISSPTKIIDRDFFALFDQNESFEIVSSVFINSGNGFNALEVINCYTMCNVDHFVTEFNLQKYPEIQQLRFDPLEGQPCKCKMESIETDGIYRGIAWKNASEQENDYDVFYTIDPMYVFDGDFSKATYIKITGKIEILDYNVISHELDTTRHELDTTRHELDTTRHELDRIINSNKYRMAVKLETITQKIGIIYPIKWTMKLYKRIVKRQ